LQDGRTIDGVRIENPFGAAEARDLLVTLEAASRQRYVQPYALALVHAGLGDADAVFEWLDRAYTAHDIHLIFLTVDPKWDPYRADPRFTALLARCGFAGGGRTERPRCPEALCSMAVRARRHAARAFPRCALFR
jgi:hypothetical protein